MPRVLPYAKPAPSLAQRSRDAMICDLIAIGHDQGEIALVFGLSIKTINRVAAKRRALKKKIEQMVEEREELAERLDG